MTQSRCRRPLRARCFFDRESVDVDYSMEVQRHGGVTLCVNSYGGEVESQTPRFQMSAVAQNNDSVESKARFRAVPIYEFFDGMTVAALSLW
jgi:hypothetical protein